MTGVWNKIVLVKKDPLSHTHPHHILQHATSSPIHCPCINEYALTQLSDTLSWDPSLETSSACWKAVGREGEEREEHPGKSCYSTCSDQLLNQFQSPHFSFHCLKWLQHWQLRSLSSGTSSSQATVAWSSGQLSIYSVSWEGFAVQPASVMQLTVSGLPSLNQT